MTAHFRSVALLPFLLVCSAVAQTSDEQLSNNFMHASGDTFMVTGDTFFRVTYNSEHLACGITVYLAKDQEQVNSIFAKAVPVIDRTTKGQDLLDCTGTCSRASDFNGATMVSAMVGSQTSTPSAVITFKDKRCTAVREALAKVVFVIKRNSNPGVSEKQ